jgi:hypothetical protein
MVPMAEVVTAVLLTAVFVWWFRRTSSYRSRRRNRGGVPGQFSGPGPTFHGQRTNVPRLQPEWRSEDDPRSGPWWRWWRRSRRP